MTPSALHSAIKQQYLLYIAVVILFLVVGKDLFESSIKDYGFYLSESVLFSTFWLIFIPGILINTMLAKRVKGVSIITLPFVFSLFHVTFFSLLVFSISGLFFDYPFGFLRVFIKTISGDSIACLLIYGVSSFLLLKKHKPSVKNELSNTSNTSNKIKVTHSNRVIILDCKDIIYVRSERPYIAFITNERTYLHNGTLKGFLVKETGENFIQIHKSTLVNTAYITSYTSRKNGDYDLTLGHKYKVRASRSFNMHFKSYFDSIDLN